MATCSSKHCSREAESPQYKKCARCREDRRTWYERNKTHVSVTMHRRHVRVTYGVDDYDGLLAAQDGVCAICRKECDTGRRLAVDHCHKTGKVRGLLCVKCNAAVAYLRDDPSLAARVGDYLHGVM